MNLPKRYRRALRLILAAALCTALAGGCALPAQTRRLDTLLEQEAVYPGVRYGYRCTAGAHRGASVTYLPFDGLTQKLYAEASATGADYLMLHTANLHNIDGLLKYKPKGKTIVFWDFDDTMYIVHKDLSDRLWGDSGIETFFQFLRYKLSWEANGG